MTKATKTGSKWRDASFLAFGVVLAIGGFGVYQITHGTAVADRAATAAGNDASTLAAELIVKASPLAQKASGIETAAISPKRVQPTIEVYADVLDLQSQIGRAHV